MRCDADGLAAVERRLGDAGFPLAELHQVDTYLHAASGRLKVREIHAVDGNTVELIAYARPDELGTRLSDYHRVAIDRDQAPALLAALRATLGEVAVVEKARRVAIVGRTRVHLDRVTGLGCFVELETVLADGEGEGAGLAESREVAALLGIDGLTPIAGSYGDLIRSSAVSRGGGNRSPEARRPATDHSLSCTVKPSSTRVAT